MDEASPVAASARRKKRGNFHVPKETVHSGCTDPTQATARLVTVFVSRIQKSCARDISVRPTEIIIIIIIIIIAVYSQIQIEKVKRR